MSKQDQNMAADNMMIWKQLVWFTEDFVGVATTILSILMLHDKVWQIDFKTKMQYKLEHWFANPFKPEFTPKSSLVLNSMYSYVLVFLYVAFTTLYDVLNYYFILLYITIFYFQLLYFTFCTNVFLSPDVIPYTVCVNLLGS